MAIMSPEDESALAQVGRGTIENLLVAIFMSFCYGIYIIAFPVALMNLTKRGLHRLPNQIMFTLTILTFISTTLFWGSYIAEYSKLIKGNLIENTNVPISGRSKIATTEAIHLYMIILWPQLINFATGDAIVVWRVWALWSSNPFVRWGMVILWCLTTVAYTIYTSWRQHLMVINSSPGFDPVAEKLQVIAFSMSTGTNILGTGLVGIKAWEYRKMIRSSPRGARHPTMVERVLALLVESGIVYCALQFTFLILNALDDHKPAGGPFDTATHILTEAAIMVGAIYPILIIILVTQSKTLDHTPGYSTARSSTLHVSHPSRSHGSGDTDLELSSMKFTDPKTTKNSYGLGTIGTMRSEPGAVSFVNV